MRSGVLVEKGFKKSFFNLLFHALFYMAIFFAIVIFWLTLKPRLRGFKLSNIWWRSEKKSGESIVVTQDVVYLLLLLAVIALAIQFIFFQKNKYHE